MSQWYLRHSKPRRKSILSCHWWEFHNSFSAQISYQVNPHHALRHERRRPHAFWWFLAVFHLACQSFLSPLSSKQLVSGLNRSRKSAQAFSYSSMEIIPCWSKLNATHFAKQYSISELICFAVKLIPPYFVGGIKTLKTAKVNFYLVTIKNITIALCYR